MASLSEIASALHARRFGKHWLARCPAHDDQTPSLSLSERNGRVLVHCHAGCSQREVIEALRDLGVWSAPERRQQRSAAPPPDREFQGDLVLAKYWRFTALALSEETLGAMRTTDPESSGDVDELLERRGVTDYARQVREARGRRLVELFREHRASYPEMTVAMIYFARQHAAAQQRQVMDFIDRECNGTF